MNDWTTEIAKACQLMSYRFPLIVVRGVGFLLGPYRRVYVPSGECPGTGYI